MGGLKKIGRTENYMEETPEETRKRRIIWTAVLILIILFSFYAWFIEPNNIVVKKVTVNIGLNKSVKIVFFSDIHVETISDSLLKKAIETANAEKPDYIFLGGDYAEGGGSGYKRLAPLENLSSAKGTYAILGNHDYPLSESTCDQEVNETGKQMEGYLSSRGISVLRNEKIDMGDFVLVGVDELWACKSNYSKAMEGVDYSRPVIVLVHNQEAIPKNEYRKLNLVLAGHTHCGYVRLPFLGSALNLFGILGENDMGLYKFDYDSYIYTSCGIGGGMRFLAPPEITVIEVE